MLVITRYRVPTEEQATFRSLLERAHEELAKRPGYQHGWLGRNVDDSTLWTLTTVWESIGSYRRALSAYDVKMHGVPILSRAIDEPSAYELVTGEGELNIDSPRSIG